VDEQTSQGYELEQSSIETVTVGSSSLSALAFGVAASPKLTCL